MDSQESWRYLLDNWKYSLGTQRRSVRRGIETVGVKVKTLLKDLDQLRQVASRHKKAEGLQTHGDGLGIIIYIIGDGLWLLVDSLWYLEGRCGYLERIAVQFVIREGLWILRDRHQVSILYTISQPRFHFKVSSVHLLSIQNLPQVFRVHPKASRPSPSV